MLQYCIVYKFPLAYVHTIFKVFCKSEHNCEMEMQTFSGRIAIIQLSKKLQCIQHSPCISISRPAGCSLLPSLGGQTPCLRGTSYHQQPLGRTEATDEAALHTVCFWRVMEVASQRITTYIALHMSSCTIWKQVPVLKQNTVTKLTTQTIRQCCLTNWI